MNTKARSSKTVVFRLKPAAHSKLIARAKAENRSLANYVAHIVYTQLRDTTAPTHLNDETWS